MTTVAQYLSVMPSQPCWLLKMAGGFLHTVNSAQFSLDGLRVVTTSIDQSARVWDAKTGKSLGDPLMHQDVVYSAQFSPDGTQLVTASSDNTARLWDVFPVLSDGEDILPNLAEAVTDYRLTELSAIEPLENQLELLEQLRSKTENAPLGEPTAESFTRWFLSDPWTRTVSPLSRLTVAEYIKQHIASGRRDQMEREFPGHPLLR
jgi:hypothetical protein